MKKWFPYHNQIPLTEGEIPMDKGGFRTVQMIIDKNDTPESITNKICQVKDQFFMDILLHGTGIIYLTVDKPEKGEQGEME